MGVLSLCQWVDIWEKINFQEQEEQKKKDDQSK